MTTADLDTRIVLSAYAERVEEDKYLVNGEAVDLADDLEPCTCGEVDCYHSAAALMHQARWNALMREAGGP
jgi:hypothetical protein